MNSPGAEMFMRMAKLSSCVSSPDCAGPAANSEAVKVRYLMARMTVNQRQCFEVQ